MNKRLRKKLYDKLLDLSRQLLDVWLASAMSSSAKVQAQASRCTVR